LAGLGLAGSSALLAGSAAASVSSAAKLTWTKLLFGVSLLGAATAVPVGYYALHHSTSIGGPSAQPSVASVPVVSAQAQDPAAPDEAQAPAAARRSALLTAELSALDHARVVLAGGDARRALEALDAYDRGFPGGRLQIEAEVLRIDALAKLGRRDIARQRAEAFLRRHPNSVLVTRVRAHLAD
jgi:hypothetical protein